MKQSEVLSLLSHANKLGLPLHYELLNYMDDKKNPLLDRIVTMKGSIDDKLIYLNEYETLWKLSPTAMKNCDLIRMALNAAKK